MNVFRFLLLITLVPTCGYASNFSSFFNLKTMRVDYYHVGNAETEQFVIDRIVDDGLWPGPRKNLLDSLRFGKYFFEVHDAESGKLLFSRGFASLFGEWQTTAAASRETGIYHESIRFPMPKEPVKIVMHKRGADNAFQAIWETVIDPKAPNVYHAEYKSTQAVAPLMNNGPSQSKVDIVILGDGYLLKSGFEEDAKRMMDALFEKEPFKSRRKDFNVWMVAPEATRYGGVTKPQIGQYKRTQLAVQYGVFGSERYMLAMDNRAMRDIASQVAYEYIIVLAKESVYGGGGIYRWQAASSTRNAFSEYVFIHEFGHSFAGLGDEYYTSSVAYNTDDLVEPWEANVTANPKDPKWADLLSDGVRLPTKWKKKRFDEHSRSIQDERKRLRSEKADEAKLEALFEKQKQAETEMLSAEKHAGKVGAFEGAGYRAEGYYRPEVDCVMFTRNDVDFCAVCSQAIEAVIDFHIDKQ